MLHGYRRTSPWKATGAPQCLRFGWVAFAVRVPRRSCAAPFVCRAGRFGSPKGPAVFPAPFTCLRLAGLRKVPPAFRGTNCLDGNGQSAMPQPVRRAGSPEPVERWHLLCRTFTGRRRSGHRSRERIHAWLTPRCEPAAPFTIGQCGATKRNRSCVSLALSTSYRPHTNVSRAWGYLSALRPIAPANATIPPASKCSAVLPEPCNRTAVQACRNQDPADFC